MLVDLESLDVPYGHGSGKGCEDNQYRNHGLPRNVGTHGSAEKDGASGIGHQYEKHNEIAVDAVEEHKLVSYDRGELKGDKDACGDGSSNMHDHAIFKGGTLCQRPKEARSKNLSCKDAIIVVGF